MPAEMHVDLGQLSTPAAFGVLAVVLLIALRGIRIHLYRHDDEDRDSR